MSDLQEIHNAPLTGPRADQKRVAWVATQLKAGVTVTSRWLLKEMKGWHDRKMAAHELSHLLHDSVRGGRARYQ